jgi:phosphoglycolate phosphatase
MAAIIFDFDGTIADSFDFVVDFLAVEAGREALTAAEKQTLRGQSMASIGRGLGLSWFRLLRLFFKGRQRMGAAIDQIKPFDGIPRLLQKLHAEGHELFILTSNTVPNVHKFLHQHELHTYFLEVYGGIGVFGKAPALRKLLGEQHLEIKDSLYVGDELRDVQAAQAVAMRMVAVAWGFARPSGLEALRPTAIAETPDDLLKVLEEQ